MSCVPFVDVCVHLCVCVHAHALSDLQKTYFELEKDKLQLQKEKKGAEEKRRAAEQAVKAAKVELARQKEENRKKEIQYAKLLKEKEISDEKRQQVAASLPSQRPAAQCSALIAWFHCARVHLLHFPRPVARSQCVRPTRNACVHACARL